MPCRPQDIDYSGRLELTLADVELLGRLPHLRLLRLSHHTKRHSTARVLRSLRRRLPHLQVL